MQAYRLRIADAHHTQVVKVCVEPRSNCAAFVLADSSCLLVSLSSLPAYQPTSIPAPCTDACFLRLQARVLAGGGSLPFRVLYPVEKGGGASGGISTSGGESRDHYAGKVGVEAGGVEAGKITPRVGPRGGGKGSSNTRVVANGNNGKSAGNTIRTRVFFLTSQPARGGSCIDVFAWHCEPPVFSRANVEIDYPKRNSRGSDIGHHPDNNDLQQRRHVSKWRAARLEIPHGMTMRMVASVNVVIVYSVSGSRIWILAAKHVGVPELPKDHGGRSFRGTGFSPAEKVSELGINRRAESGGDVDSSGHLLLMKCAVLECNRPVYSLFVSPQHLLLGEAGGVWIWPLRPLIKPGKRLKERERPKDLPKDLTLMGEVQSLSVSKNSQMDPTMKDLAVVHAEHASNGEVSAVAGISELRPVRKNGLYAGKGDDKEQVKRGDAIPGNEIAPRNGLHDKERKVCLVVRTQSSGNGFNLELDSGSRGSPRQGNGQQQGGNAQPAGNDFVGLPLTHGIPVQDNHLKVSSMTQDYIAAAVKDDLQNMSNGTHYVKEDADHLGKRAIMESLWKAGGVQKRNGVVLHNGNCHEIMYNVDGSQSFSSGSEGIGSVETNTLSEDLHLSDEKLIAFSHVKQKQGLGLVGPMFVATCKESQQDGFMAGKGGLQAQVVDIQEISLRRFVVLDSSGDLHLLALEDIQDRGTNSVRVSHPKMTPLRTSMKVSSMAVLLPAVQGTPAEVKRGVVRKLWLSDGRYSNYVGTIPEDGAEEVSLDFKTAGGCTPGLPVRVSQTIFISERVAALAAVSTETVLVVTQGSIIAYVISGS